jgi:alcohol dehydrogenase class IV
MWYFRSPEVVFGRDALDHLAYIQGQRAAIVTDETMVRLGFVEVVRARLTQAGLACHVFDQVEPEPSLQTVQRGAAFMLETKPDWIVGLGGGSALDAAKAMWILYERPDLTPEDINPFAAKRAWLPFPPPAAPALRVPGPWCSPIPRRGVKCPPALPNVRPTSPS